MTTQVRPTTSTTQERPAAPYIHTPLSVCIPRHLGQRQLCAGSACGTCGHTVCSTNRRRALASNTAGGQLPPMKPRTYYGPENPDEPSEQARRIRSRIAQLLETLDMPRCSFQGPVWEEEYGQDDQQLRRPVWGREDEEDRAPRTSSIIAQQCGKLVLTTWGDIYETPPCLWLPKQSGSNPAQVAAVTALSGGEEAQA